MGYSDVIFCQQPLDYTLVENTGPRDPGGPTLKLFLGSLGLEKIRENWLRP